MTEATLKYPWMRSELLEHLDWLSRSHQTGRTPSTGDLDEAIHFLFDDTPLPEEAVGYYLLGADEVDALRPVIAALDAMLERHGTDLSEEAYLRLPEWLAVAEAARKALERLQARADADPQQ